MSCVVTTLSVPPNAENFTAVSQLETSITLQWNQVRDNFSFILVIDGAEKRSVSQYGGETVTYIVSNLAPATTHTFVLISVLQGAQSSGVLLSAVTGKKTEMTEF